MATSHRAPRSTKGETRVIVDLILSHGAIEPARAWVIGFDPADYDRAQRRRTTGTAAACVDRNTGASEPIAQLDPRDGLAAAPAGEACGGLPTARVVRMTGFSPQEVRAADPRYETRSDSGRLGRNLRPMREHMSAPGQVRFSGNTVVPSRVATRRTSENPMTTRFFPRAGRLLAALGLIASASLALAAEAAFPPAGSVGLVPPPGMTPAKAFAGFEHRSGASILIAEMPAEAYGPLVEKFTPEALRATGFEAREAGMPLGVVGGEGRVLRGRQAANGLAYAKWVAVVRGGAATGLVTVQVPEAARGQVPDEAVEAALSTIAFRSPGSLADQMAALPYGVGDLAGFRPVRTLMGNALMLTDGPKDIDPDGVQPMIVVAPSLGRAAVPTGQEGAFARKALASFREIKDVTVTGEERTSRDGAVVHRLRAAGVDPKSGRAVVLTQTIRFDPAGYLRILGLAPADRTEALARAERVAASVTMR